ncbi:unnamed protein product, partial [Tenebrio molitor]
SSGSTKTDFRRLLLESGLGGKRRTHCVARCPRWKFHGKIHPTRGQKNGVSKHFRYAGLRQDLVELPVPNFCLDQTRSNQIKWITSCCRTEAKTPSNSYRR